MSRQPQLETVGGRDDEMVGRWQDWFTMILGFWLIIAPFAGIGMKGDIAAWNSYICGAIVAILAVAAVARPKLWEEWVNLVIGVWLVLAPFVLGFTDQSAPMWNQIIVGLLISADAVWVAVQSSGRRAHHA